MWPVLFLLALSVVKAEHPPYDIDYSDKDARLLLRLSGLAYASDPRICLRNIMPAEEQWAIERAKEVPCDADDNVCAVVVMSSAVTKEIIVAFKAEFSDAHLQQEIHEWMGPEVNFDNYGNVGQYFASAVNKTWPTVEPSLINPLTRDYRVTFTGYSLGGAVATLSSMMTFIKQLRRPEQVRSITFGEPRVGDDTFAGNYDRIIQNSYRVVHKADIVPHLVACRKNSDSHICDSNANLRRVQHASEVWYENDMAIGSGFLICSKVDEDSHCSDSLDGEYNMNDHRRYFGLPVAQYGIDNCERTDYPGGAAPYSTILSISLSILFAVIAAC